MKTVASVADIPATARLSQLQPDGSVICYMPGDALPPAPEPPHEEMALLMAAPYSDAVQSMLDSAAQARAYDGILSMVSYAGDAHPKFGPEGAAAEAWRTKCWAKCYEIIAAVESGARPMPTVAELLAEMPALVI